MYIKQATVNNQVGLHARPATFFIQKANEFKSTIWVEKDEQRVNAKSLLGVLSLGIIKGSTIDLIADGTDEKDAVDALVDAYTTPTSGCSLTYWRTSSPSSPQLMDESMRRTVAGSGAVRSIEVRPVS